MGPLEAALGEVDHRLAPDDHPSQFPQGEAHGLLESRRGLDAPLLELRPVDAQPGTVVQGQLEEDALRPGIVDQPGIETERNDS